MVYLVTVTNLGTVYLGSNGSEAKKTYEEYVSLSKRQEGRAGGESVVLMQGSQTVKEHRGRKK